MVILSRSLMSCSIGLVFPGSSLGTVPPFPPNRQFHAPSQLLGVENSKDGGDARMLSIKVKNKAEG
ncbi:unnamed protein product [Tuber melanosporum]|uniref:(Perigord truffle) hypothetical protein n=1 Tax=Tuber melanosporum (strain Mel28) TaxID=656061 RepID=D5GIB5_TUBMM|nr:uncharacterized protein GSTUM_00008398001 [Tuber melanosporum]CAZ84258.1 unnamed protein product [Tuber melanosporum]